MKVVESPRSWRWPHRGQPLPWRCPRDKTEKQVLCRGHLCDQNFDAALSRIVLDLDDVMATVPSFPLCKGCAPAASLRQRLQAIIDGTSDELQSTWFAVRRLRIAESWRSQPQDLVWVQDKVLQVDMTTELCGERLHLPLWSHALSEDTEGLEKLRNVVRNCVRNNEAIVVKPRHGANSALVCAWPNPRDAGEEAIMESVDAARLLRDKSWDKLDWLCSQITRGVIVQPLYRTSLAAADKYLDIPLELAVEVIWGKVVGATLNEYPAELWITRDGAVQQWCAKDLREVPGRRYRKDLPDGLLNILLSLLHRHWDRILYFSERLVQRAGLDELRVDWVVGDDRWGACILELTYMGTAHPYPIPQLSEGLSLCYASGYFHYIESHGEHACDHQTSS
eukprot:TRINITY_DN50271_c0_g1_i1.p1 TRINITY_DN50271_c0_g1~~TRINITY_DN50271_c0_g1_i1.p1  ORF type:complete len:394 (-),score=4.08 TRINITY_DN50271_c0_g1_i1:22-1203(-)